MQADGDLYRCTWHDASLVRDPFELHPTAHVGDPPAVRGWHEKEQTAKQPEKPAPGKQSEKQEEKTNYVKGLLRVHCLHAFLDRGRHAFQNLLHDLRLRHMQLGFHRQANPMCGEARKHSFYIVRQHEGTT